MPMYDRKIFLTITVLIDLVRRTVLLLLYFHQL